MDLIITACRALAHQPRLRLLRAIHERPASTVQALAGEVGLPVAAASLHLKLLSGLHLIQTTPSGRYVRCSPARPGSTNNEFLRELQTLVIDLFGAGSLNRTLSKVCDSIPRDPQAWDAVFEAMRKHVTTFTHLRRLLILRMLAQRGPCRPEQITSGIGMSADAARRQLGKLSRRGVIAPAPANPEAWTLVRTVHPPCRRQLLEIVLRAMKSA